jgi:bifunctional N-acetylglucosamine-1-phosphate-uridyltransferase/glucosamine-1-phosphate-acetyltransferase GlmU-like protein
VIDISRYIPSLSRSALARWSHLDPRQITTDSAAIVRMLLAELPKHDFIISAEIAVYRSAIIESGAVLKGPLILGAGCFVASGAYLRGGSWVAESCIFGPGAELKSSFASSGTKLAHFNFVGDSLLGADVNLEAGSIICNYRNERPGKEIQVRIGSRLRATGADKFGAPVGEGCRSGANAVVAPGAILTPSTVIRTQLCDQEIDAD